MRRDVTPTRTSSSNLPTSRARPGSCENLTSTRAVSGGGGRRGASAAGAAARPRSAKPGTLMRPLDAVPSCTPERFTKASPTSPLRAVVSAQRRRGRRAARPRPAPPAPRAPRPRAGRLARAAASCASYCSRICAASCAALASTPRAWPSTSRSSAMRASCSCCTARRRARSAAQPRLHHGAVPRSRSTSCASGRAVALVRVRGDGRPRCSSSCSEVTSAAARISRWIRSTWRARPSPGPPAAPRRIATRLQASSCAARPPRTRRGLR